MSQIYPALSRLLGLNPAGMADTPDLGGAGSPEDDTGASSQAPERQTLSPDDSLRRALEAVPEPTATQLDRLNPGPEPSVPQGNPINPTGPQIYNRNWRGGYDEDNNPYARHANGSFMSGRQAQQLMEMSNGQGWHRQGERYILGPAPSPQQINAQLTANMPLSQTERMYSQQLQQSMARVQYDHMHNGLSTEAANRTLEELQRHYGPIAAREAHEKEMDRLQRRQERAADAGDAAQAEAIGRQIRAQSAQSSVSVVQSPHGPITLIPNEKGGFTELKPQPLPQPPDEPQSANERLLPIMNAHQAKRYLEAQESARKQVQEAEVHYERRLTARRNAITAEEKKRKDESMPALTRDEIARDFPTPEAPEWYNQGPKARQRMIEQLHREAHMAIGGEHARQHWARIDRERAALANAGPQPGQAQQPTVTGTNIPRQGQAPAGAPGVPAAAPPQQNAGQTPPAQAQASPPPATPAARAASAFDLNLADVRQQAAALRNPAATSYVHELSNRVAAIMRAYPPGTTPPASVRERYRAYRSIINEHLKGEKQKPMTRQELIESFTDTVRHGG